MTTAHQKGFTLVEMVMALILLSTAILAVITVFAPTVQTHVTNQERTQLSLILSQQKEHIQSLGFWVWDGDSNQAPANSQHPINTWTTKLSTQGQTVRVALDTTFLKQSGNTLVPFATEPFDQGEARNSVYVILSTYTTSGSVVTDSITLHSAPRIEGAWSQLRILKKALEMYAADNGGNYPPTTSFASALVPAYLDEIPNNPLTSLQPKSTHMEEASDWYYQNSNGQITLAANSHRSLVQSTW